MSKIGFLLGSFDPIHVGHINMIRTSLESNIIDKVIVVPSVHNPWKTNTPASFELRVNMIEEAIRPFGDKCGVSLDETRFEEPHYSYKVLSYLRGLYSSDELYIICGGDTVNSIKQWKNADTDILPYFKKLVIARNKHDMILLDDRTELINGGLFQISSTQIRELVQKGKEIYPLVTEGVKNIIIENSLYKTISSKS